MRHLILLFFKTGLKDIILRLNLIQILMHFKVDMAISTLFIFPDLMVPALTSADVCYLAIAQVKGCSFRRKGFLKAIINEKSLLIKVNLIRLDSINLINLI